MTISSAALAHPGRPASRDEPERLAALVSDNYDFVWRSLRRLGVSESEAEDVAQEVFMTLSRRLDDVEPGRERGFLYRTAAHHAAHAHRSRLRRREVTDEGLEESPASTRTPEELLDGARARALFYELLDELVFEQRVVFVLYELEHMTMAEIAETLDLPSGTVASRLRRGRAAFRDCLRQRCPEEGAP